MATLQQRSAVENFRMHLSQPPARRSRKGTAALLPGEAPGTDGRTRDRELPSGRSSFAGVGED